MSIGRQDYYAPGDYNAICDRCGGKFKASQLSKDWHGWMLCTRCWEPRHPQDFVRGKSTTAAESGAPPFTRPPATDSFAAFCTIPGQTSLPDAAVPDCWKVEYVHPSFDPNVT